MYLKTSAIQLTKAPCASVNLWIKSSYVIHATINASTHILLFVVYLRLMKVQFSIIAFSGISQIRKWIVYNVMYNYANSIMVSTHCTRNAFSFLHNYYIWSLLIIFRAWSPWAFFTSTKLICLVFSSVGSGGWITDGVNTVGNASDGASRSTVNCASSHLTSFAVLFTAVRTVQNWQLF